MALSEAIISGTRPEKHNWNSQGLSTCNSIRHHALHPALRLLHDDLFEQSNIKPAEKVIGTAAITTKATLATAHEDKIFHQYEVLLGHHKSQHPNAGSIYWSNHIWQVTTWQLVYAAIGSIHIHQHAIDVKKIQQYYDQGRAIGYSYTFDQAHGFNQNSKNVNDIELIAFVAAKLQKLLATKFELLEKLIRLNRTNCFGLIADFVFNALTPLVADQDQHYAIFRLWVHHLKLINRSGIPLSQQRRASNNKIEIKRLACCKHIVIAPHDACCDCPQGSKQACAF